MLLPTTATNTTTATTTTTTTTTSTTLTITLATITSPKTLYTASVRKLLFDVLGLGTITRPGMCCCHNIAESHIIDPHA